MTERKGVWFGFQLAAEEVERRLGLTWGAAQKTLIEACKNGKIETRSNYSGQGTDVFDVDFYQWLNAKQSPPPSGKQLRILKLLADMHSNGVPAPALCPRKILKDDLIKRDPTLSPLDEDTLKKAIDKHNAMVRPTHPKRS